MKIKFIETQIMDRKNGGPGYIIGLGACHYLTNIRRSFYLNSKGVVVKGFKAIITGGNFDGEVVNLPYSFRKENRVFYIAQNPKNKPEVFK